MVTKKTEIGVLPSDWSVATLLDCLCGKPSYGINAPAIAYSPQKPRYIRITDITEAGTYSKSSPASVEDVNIDRYYLKKNDIVLARTGASVGKSYLYQKDDGNLVYAGFLIKLSINDIVADARYVFACLHTQRYWQWVNTISVRSGQPGINGEEYSAYLLPLPSRVEQTVIADSISDVDSLIFSLQKLIEKKKAIKQGTMQELLTGKKRLPGFSEEWTYRRVGELCSITKGQIITEKTAIHGNVPVIAGGKTPAFYHNVANRKSDVITISASGANAGYIAYHDYPIFASDCSTIENSGQYDVKFIYYALLYHQQELIGMQTGGAQPHIHPKEIGVLMVPRINQEEQRAIANVLSDMDSEIEQLEKKLSKYQQIKQGMMQELLTGRIRLANQCN